MCYGTLREASCGIGALAGEGQVLVVTHSPQVAALGAHHWRVEKRVEGSDSFGVEDSSGTCTGQLRGRTLSGLSRTFSLTPRELTREAAQPAIRSAIPIPGLAARSDLCKFG